MINWDMVAFFVGIFTLFGLVGFFFYIDNKIEEHFERNREELIERSIGELIKENPEACKVIYSERNENEEGE